MDRPDIEQIRELISNYEVSPLFKNLVTKNERLMMDYLLTLCDYIEELEKRIGDYCYEPADIHIRVVNIDKDGNPTFDHPEYLRAGDGLTLGSGLYYRTSNKCKLCGSRLTRDDD